MAWDEKSYRRYITGKRNRAAGNKWENIVKAACERYWMEGRAEIEKTPEPMRPISRPNERGQFLACFTKQAQPDYQGTLSGGRSIVFDAKHTAEDRIERKAVTEEQEKELERHHRLGAVTFVLVSFGFQRYFCIPWEVFREMKERYGRKYMKPDEMPEYEVRYLGGFLRFLE